MNGYSLTVGNDHPQFANILALLNGTAIAGGVVIAGIPGMGGSGGIAATGEDDESSDNANVAVGSLDANNLPWDERIHSTPAALTKKNVWRSKRNVSPALVTQVEAELRARMNGGAPVQPGYPQMQQQPPVPQMTPPANVPLPSHPAPQYQQPPQQPQYAPAPEHFTVPGSITGGEAVTLQTQPPAQQYQQPPVPAQQYQQPSMQQMPNPQPQYQQPPVPQMNVDWQTFMQKIQSMLPTGQVDAVYLNSVAARVGANAITDIAADAGKINMAASIMVSEGRWQ